MDRCDLHMHSTASDGTDPPEVLPRLVKDAGLVAFALTDHDTVAGLSACAKAAARIRVTFVPGIELSADVTPLLPSGVSAPRATLHLLGYGINASDVGLQAVCEKMQRGRALRHPQILAKLAEQGVTLPDDFAANANPAEPHERSAGTAIGRPHIAAALLAKGYVKTIQEAFVLYLGQGACAYVPRARLTPAEAVAAIRNAGGVAVLAHPVQLNLDDASLEHVIARLIDLGLGGLEVLHPDHDIDDIRHFRKLADRFNLLATGGSDYHGSTKSTRLGSQRVPATTVDALRARASSAAPATSSSARRG